MIDLLNWQIPFIKNLSQILLPLKQLVKQETDLNKCWKTEHDVASEHMERHKLNSHLLSHSNFDLVLVFYTDRSDHAIGDV